MKYIKKERMKYKSERQCLEVCINIHKLINNTPRNRGVYYFFKFHTIDIQAFERVSKNSIS